MNNEELLEKLKADLFYTVEQITLIEIHTPDDQKKYSLPLRYLYGRQEYISSLVDLLESK